MKIKPKKLEFFTLELTRLTSIPSIKMVPMLNQVKKCHNNIRNLSKSFAFWLRMKPFLLTSFPEAIYTKVLPMSAYVCI